MTLKASKRSAIEPFIVMDVMRAAALCEAQGQHVLHMEVGQPSTPAPGLVLDAARTALDKELLGYTDAFGVPHLKDAIAQHYQNTYGLDIDPAQIAVTTGSSGGFVLAFLSAFDAGDRVALVSPGYPAYRNILKALDIEVVNIDVGPDTIYQPTIELLAQVQGNLDGLIIASPSNPTGTMIDRAGLKALAGYC
ncbi:MAG: aminotransferase class I/II-fold pyridoxal phosphate-dependent enzyme, partial [Magnetovibrio sp.]|nr:aminotransferase class I/II-fold pyridoxal phosphate-dependent enzyme [Magnetovibrio sp.]